MRDLDWGVHRLLDGLKRNCPQIHQLEHRKFQKKKLLCRPWSYCHVPISQQAGDILPTAVFLKRLDISQKGPPPIIVYRFGRTTICGRTQKQMKINLTREVLQLNFAFKDKLNIEFFIDRITIHTCA